MLKRRELLQYSGGLLALSCLPAGSKPDDMKEVVTTLTRFDKTLSNQQMLSNISDRRKAKGHLALKILQNDTEILLVEERRAHSRSELKSYKKLDF